MFGSVEQTLEAAEEGAPGGRQRGLLVLLLAVATLPHLVSLAAGFTFDDREFVMRNESIRSLGSALRAFAAPFPPEQPERGLYRPLTNLSYALDHAVGGGAPAAFHATQVLLYAVVVALAALLARRVLPDPRAAAVAALLFAAHPVHCEAVDSVAGRSELLALLLGLATACLYVSAVSADARPARLLRLAAAAACFGLAALAKETALVLPGVLAALAVLVAPDRRRAATALLPFAAIAVAALGLRLAVLGAPTPAVTVLGDAPFATRLFTMGAIYLEYLRLLVFPSTLQVDFFYAHRIGLHAAASPAAVAGLAAFALTLGLLLSLLWQGRLAEARPGVGARRARGAAFGLLVFLGFLLPVSHVVPFGALLAERFLFAPSLGFALLVGVGLDRALALASPAGGRALRVGAAVALVLLCSRATLRAAEWRDPVTLWTPVERHVRDDFRVYNNLAAGHLARGDVPEALGALQRSLELEPDNLVALRNLAFAFLETRHYEAARRAYQRALALDPTDAVAWNGLGVIEVRSGRPEAALPHYRRALAANPNYATARANLRSAERVLASAPPAGR